MGLRMFRLKVLPRCLWRDGEYYAKKIEERKPTASSFAITVFSFTTTYTATLEFLWKIKYSDLMMEVLLTFLLHAAIITVKGLVDKTKSVIMKYQWYWYVLNSMTLYVRPSLRPRNFFKCFSALTFHSNSYIVLGKKFDVQVVFSKHFDSTKFDANKLTSLCPRGLKLVVNFIIKKILHDSWVSHGNNILSSLNFPLHWNFHIAFTMHCLSKTHQHPIISIYYYVQNTHLQYIISNFLCVCAFFVI